MVGSLWGHFAEVSPRPPRRRSASLKGLVDSQAEVGFAVPAHDSDAPSLSCSRGVDISDPAASVGDV
jgi:hypothetical protein